MDEKKIAELKAKHPNLDLHVVETAHGTFVVRAPTRAEWHAFKKASKDEMRAKVAAENFAAACGIEPSGDALQTLFESRPALAETMAGELAEIAGLDNAASHRRL